MDNNFTDLIQKWLQSPDNERDYTLGALYLLKLSNNQIMYRNNIATLSRQNTQAFISYQLQKFYNFRLAKLTHQQVEEMAHEVQTIADKLHLNTTDSAIEKSAERKNYKPGKREDHEKLPDEIQALYVENLDILHRMRELHMQLRHISGLSSSKEICQDSDRFPFLKDLIALDKKYHANWEKYDNYTLDET